MVAPNPLGGDEPGSEGTPGGPWPTQFIDVNLTPEVANDPLDRALAVAMQVGGFPKGSSAVLLVIKPDGQTGFAVSCHQDHAPALSAIVHDCAEEIQKDMMPKLKSAEDGYGGFNSLEKSSDQQPRRWI